jgi:glutamine synthetase
VNDVTSQAKENVLRQVKENNVRFVRLWFTDILGFLKSFSVSVSELETALESGMGFDGSSVEGFARIDESDMIAMPDPSTFTIFPVEWSTPESVEARMFCDIQNPGGQPFDGDPRYILKNNLKRAADMGYTFNVGPELEFFYYKDSESTVGLDNGGYFDLTPLDMANDLRRNTVLALEGLGVQVEFSHHEVAPSQHEIDMKYADALTMADTIMTYRLVVKEIALQHGAYATFMPKPQGSENGSGMHVHQSLFKGNRNAFFDKDAEGHLSLIAKQYIAGIMRHAPEITAITNQWVNSYKRLVPGYEAPVYVSWAQRNRSDLVRVPMYKPGNEKATRMELRSPDPACNPYLTFAVMLAAGLEGIENKYELPEPIEENIYEMGEDKRNELGIVTLPGTLDEAIEILEQSELVRKCLGDHIFYTFIKNKKMECEDYRKQVTDYELKKYLPIL